MRVESAKSIILILLISFSLILTVALWYYQPDYKEVSNNETVKNTELNGEQETMSQIIRPDKVVFSNNNGYYTYKDSYKNNEHVKQLMDKMKNFPLLDITATKSKGIPEGDRSVELLFPASLPSDVITDLFSISDSNSIVSKVDFNRIFFVYKGTANEDSSAEVVFVNDQNDKVLKGLLPKNGAAALIKDLTNNKDVLRDEFLYTPDQTNHRIYLPEDKVDQVPKKLLTYNAIDVSPLQNNLLSGDKVTTIISGNQKEQRGTYKRLTYTDTWLHYVNVDSALIGAVPSMSKYQIMTKALNEINAQMGWTDTFKLNGVSTSPQKVDYLMHYNGIPVLSSSKGTSTISITYSSKNGNIREYSRPLINFDSYRYSESQDATLPSGNDVVTYIKDSPQYNEHLIDDIRIGYSLYPQKAGSPAYNLIPQWFVHENGKWKELDLEEQGISSSKGGE